MSGRKQNRRLDYQRLEPRQLLAGNVSVSLDGSVLNVTGDSLANEFRIVGNPSRGATVIATAGTTINNSPDPFVVASGLRQANVRLDDGNDSVEISELFLSDGLNVTGQDGNDRIRIDGLNVRSLDANGGNGDDVLEFHNTYSRRDIRIGSQAGADVVSITAMAADRNFYLETGDGSDTIAINNLGVRKSIYLSSGAGDDSVLMTGEVYGYKTKIRLGDGNDTLGILPETNGTTATFRRRLDIKTGSGDDRVLIGPGVTSNRLTKIKGDAGNDSLETTGAALRRMRVSGFENRQSGDLNQALDAFYASLNSAGVDTTPFGRVPTDRMVPPTFSVNNTTLQLDRSATATAIDGQLVLTGGGFDVTGATIRAIGNVANEDILAFSNTAAITGTFDATTGELALTGTATLPEYQSALRTITYDNTSSTFTGTRSIDFSVVTEGGTVQDSREIQILTDAQAIQNFAIANDLQLQQTASGLQYLIETPGNNVSPAVADSVRVKYRGTLLDGTQFDANDDATFPLSGVIPGFREGLLLFSEGATGQLFIPSALAYGESGRPNIPPNSILRFELELLAVL